MAHTRIVIGPQTDSKAMIKGTQVSVADILQSLASGMTTQNILARYPDLIPEDVQQALAYAATVVDTAPPPPAESPARPVIFNMHPGAMRMSDDFDAPLPDSFWMGEDE